MTYTNAKKALAVYEGLCKRGRAVVFYIDLFASGYDSRYVVERVPPPSPWYDNPGLKGWDSVQS